MGKTPCRRCSTRTPCQSCPWQHEWDESRVLYLKKISPGAHYNARCPGDDKSHHVDDRHLQSLHRCPDRPFAQWLPQKTNLWGLDAWERIGTARVLRGAARCPFKIVASVFEVDPIMWLVSSPDIRSQAKLPEVQWPTWSPLLIRLKVSYFSIPFIREMFFFNLISIRWTSLSHNNKSN